jgi:hypothetical protein
VIALSLSGNLNDPQTWPFRRRSEPSRASLVVSMILFGADRHEHIQIDNKQDFQSRLDTSPH